MDKKAIEGEDAEKAKVLFDEFVIRFQEGFDYRTNEIEEIIDEIRRKLREVATDMEYGEELTAKVWYEVVAPWLEELIKAFIY